MLFVKFDGFDAVLDDNGYMVDAFKHGITPKKIVALIILAYYLANYKPLKHAN
jgi:hypothetical protein